MTSSRKEAIEAAFLLTFREQDRREYRGEVFDFGELIESHFIKTLSEWGFYVVPAEPTTDMLGIIASPNYPDDHQAGVAAQRHLGCDVIPPVYELEQAYGQYRRLIAMASEQPTGDCNG